MGAVWEYGPLLLRGVGVTLAVSLASLALAVTLGVLGALAKLSDSAALRWTASTYTAVIRSIPDLCLLLLIYFGGQELVNRIGDATGLWDYAEVNRFTASVLAIGFIYGAYMTETFRAAMLAIPRGQHEAAAALALSRGLALRFVILRQLCHYALPGFSNNWLVLLKTTALVSVIGLQDIVWQSFTAGRSTRQLFTFFLVALAVYLAITFVSDRLLARSERRLSAGFHAPGGGGHG